MSSVFKEIKKRGGCSDLRSSKWERKHPMAAKSPHANGDKCICLRDANPESDQSPDENKYIALIHHAFRSLFVFTESMQHQYHQSYVDVFTSSSPEHLPISKHLMSHTLEKSTIAFHITQYLIIIITDIAKSSVFQ